MATTSEISLVGLPWPISLLQCYRHVHGMGPGDRLQISVADGDIVESLILILNSLPEHAFEIFTCDGRYRIRVTRGAPPKSGGSTGPGGDHFLLER